MLDYTEYVKLFVTLLAIINPLGAISMFIALTPGKELAARKKVGQGCIILRDPDPVSGLGRG
ncbi:MAG: MarC family protein [Nitrospirales bacterium]